MKFVVGVTCLENIFYSIHAFSGCDTTSAPFGKGKHNFLSLIIKNKDMQIISEIMNDAWIGQGEVGRAAVKAFQIIYSGKNKDSLCKLR